MPDRIPTSLTDGVAVITGATGALGHAMARDLASRGMDLILIGRRSDRLRQLVRELHDNHGIRAEPLEADLADAGTVANLPLGVSTCAAGPVRLIVHCAACNSRRDSDMEAGSAFRNVHLNAISELVETTLPDMIGAGAGQIILISSNMAILPRARKSPYGAAKAELEALARTWRARTAGTGVHMLVVVPGIFDSALLRAGMERYPLWLRHVLRPRHDVGTVAQQILDKGLGREGLLVTGWPHRVVRAMFGPGSGA